MSNMPVPKSSEGNPPVDVVVVGGGISGLIAAWEIKRRDKKLRVLVLEAKDRLGGRTLSVPLKTATGEDVWDLGGQWVSSDHHQILDVLAELHLQTFPQFTEGRKLIHMSDDTVKTYTGSIPNLSLPVLLDFERTIRKINRICKSMSAETFASHPHAEYYDSINVETLSNRYIWTDSAMRMMRVAVEAIFGAHPSQLSAFFFLSYVASAGGFNKMIEATKGGAQELRVKGGTQQISNLIAEKIGLENIHLTEPVISLEEMEDSVRVVTKNGRVFDTQKVIMAIPVHLNGAIKFSPPLPTSKCFLFNNMPLGNLVKVIVVYEEAFWRKEGYSGEAGNEGHVDSQYDEPIDIVFDATSANGNPALVAFMSSQRGILWADVQADERKEAVLKCLSKFFGEEALSPVTYIEKNWYLEPYTGGCPTSLCNTGLMKFYSMLRIPNGRIHWAGTETATEWIGYMEGAVSAGKRASLEVLLELRADLLTPSERASLSLRSLQRRKSQIIRQKHKVFRYTLGLSLLVISIVTFKKMYFRIAI